MTAEALIVRLLAARREIQAVENELRAAGVAWQMTEHGISWTTDGAPPIPATSEAAHG